MKLTFEQWFENKYQDACQWRDWQTAEYLMEFESHIEYGFKAALEMLENKQSKEEPKEELEFHVDGVKVIKR